MTAQPAARVRPPPKQRFLMSPIPMAVLQVAVGLVSATAGWVCRDARARGLPMRKALTWAAISTQEWPVTLLRYRRIRPRRIRGEEPPVEVALAVLAWRDLVRRIEDQVRGKRRLWWLLVSINPGNSVIYWLFGRR